MPSTGGARGGGGISMDSLPNFERCDRRPCVLRRTTSGVSGNEPNIPEPMRTAPPLDSKRN